MLVSRGAGGRLGLVSIHSLSYTCSTRGGRNNGRSSSTCLLFFYVIVASKVISGCVPTCDGAHSWQLYSAASLGHQVARTMTCYPNHSHSHDTEPTSPCPILIMPSVRLGNDKYQF